MDAIPIVDAAQIIEALGGRDTVSSLTGALPNAVTQWRHDGIPGRYWHKIVHRAQETDGADWITFSVLELIWERSREKRKQRAA